MSTVHAAVRRPNSSHRVHRRPPLHLIRGCIVIIQLPVRSHIRQQHAVLLRGLKLGLHQQIRGLLVLLHSLRGYIPAHFLRRGVVIKLVRRNVAHCAHPRAHAVLRHRLVHLRARQLALIPNLAGDAVQRLVHRALQSICVHIHALRADATPASTTQHRFQRVFARLRRLHRRHIVRCSNLLVELRVELAVLVANAANAEALLHLRDGLHDLVVPLGNGLDIHQILRVASNQLAEGNALLVVLDGNHVLLDLHDRIHCTSSLFPNTTEVEIVSNVELPVRLLPIQQNIVEHIKLHSLLHFRDRVVQILRSTRPFTITSLISRFVGTMHAKYPCGSDGASEQTFVMNLRAGFTIGTFPSTRFCSKYSSFSLVVSTHESSFSISLWKIAYCLFSSSKQGSSSRVFFRMFRKTKSIWPGCFTILSK